MILEDLEELPSNIEGENNQRWRLQDLMTHEKDDYFRTKQFKECNKKVCNGL